MFTGIVEDLGEIEKVEHLGDFARIHVRSMTATDGGRPGDSISVNGVCLTVTGLLGDPPPALANPDAPPPPSRPGPPRGFTADVMGETLARSSLAGAHPGTRVNLERSVRMQDRLGGHLVQGHVDGTATIISRNAQQHWEVVRVSLPGELARYVVHKGSIAVDGVSLTVSAISATAEDPDWFEVSLIPETLKRTTLGLRQPGELVNLEVDVMAKYVEKLLGAGGGR
jgi:riboflavin synthase